LRRFRRFSVRQRCETARFQKDNFLPALRHVRLRDGVFQYERRVPARVQRDARRFEAMFGSRPLFRRSLRTKDQGVAMAAASAVHAEFERLVAAPSSTAAPVAAEPMLRMVTNEDLNQLAERYRDLTARPFERLHQLANVDQAAADELDRLEYQIGLDADSIRQTVKARNPSEGDLIIHPAEEARALVRELGFHAPEGSQELGAIIASIRTGTEQGFARVNLLGSAEAVPTLMSISPMPLKARSITLAEAVERYLEARQLPAKAVSETRLALRQFEAAIGRKALSAVTRDDVHKFVEHLSNMKVGGKSAGSVERHLSVHSIGKRLRLLSSAIRHAKDRGWLDGENPAQGVRVATFAKGTDKAVMPDKRRLQISEMNAIFEHPWFTGCASATDTHSPGAHRLRGCEYWAPVVAAYTGCRAAELGGLKVSEVRLNHRFPHLIIRDNEYRRTKSRRSRCVPLLDALRSLGFDEYYERISAEGHDRLFPDWTARKPLRGGDAAFPAWSNAAIIRAFNRTVIPASLGDLLAKGARREVTFHSLRGAFKAMLGTSNNLPVNIVHEVIGHAKSEIDARYIGELSIEETYPMVHRCDYSGLIIPHYQ
jgi:integrase